MTVTPLPLFASPNPDAPLSGSVAAPDAGGGFARALGGALDAARAQFDRADAAEAAFVSGGGSLRSMVLERAQADVALSLATAAASRVTQSLTTILGMQV